MKQIETTHWKPFQISSLFTIVKGKRLTKADMKRGLINFIGASAENNGITAKIANKEHLHKGGTITVSYNGSVGETFYHEEPFWASDDVNVLYPKFNLTKNIAMFLIPLIKCKGRNYAFVNKWGKTEMENDVIYLPVCNNGKPDYDYMEQYISELASSVINSLNALEYAEEEH